MTADPYTASVHIAARPEQVFEYVTRAEAIVRWMGDYAVLDPSPGGEFTVDINGVPVRGRYLELEPPGRLLISWGHAGSERLPPGTSTVEITLTQEARERLSESSTPVCPSSKRASTRWAGRTSSSGWPSPAQAAIPAPTRGLNEPEGASFARGGCLSSLKAYLTRLEDHDAHSRDRRSPLRRRTEQAVPSLAARSTGHLLREARVRGARVRANASDELVWSWKERLFGDGRPSDAVSAKQPCRTAWGRLTAARR